MPERRSKNVKVTYALCNMINNRPRLAIPNLNCNVSAVPGLTTETNIFLLVVIHVI